MSTARAQGTNSRLTLSLRNSHVPFFSREASAKYPATKNSTGIINTSNSSRMMSAAKELVSWTTQCGATVAYAPTEW